MSSKSSGLTFGLGEIDVDSLSVMWPQKNRKLFSSM